MMKRPGKKVGIYHLIDGAARGLPDAYRQTVAASVSVKAPRAEQLSDLLQREVSIDWRRVCGLTIDLCSKLSALHRQGLAHGKLEPAKIIAETEQACLRNARIINPSLFSLLGANDKSAWDKTAFPYFCAETFLSPEQKSGKNATPASDVYALGALMYTALTGSPPRPQEKILNPFRRDNSGLNLSAYGVPVQLETIVWRCLQINPGDRYGSADDLLSAIVWWDPWLGQSRKLDSSKFFQSAWRKGLAASAILALVGLSVFALKCGTTTLGQLAGQDKGFSITIVLKPGQSQSNETSHASETELVADDR